MYVPGLSDLLLTSRFSSLFAATTSQFANQILGIFSHVFRHYIPGGLCVGKAAVSDMGQDLATGTQRLAAHCLRPAPLDWAHPGEEIAKNISYSVSSLKVERGGVDGTDTRCGKSTSIRI